MRLLALLWRIYDDGGKVTYSKAAIASYMRSSRIEHDIDDAEVQSVFQKWHEDGKIEFIRQDDLYLMLLVPKRG
jgi:hypothetical protein